MEALNLLFGFDGELEKRPPNPRPLLTPNSEPNKVEGRSYIAHDWRKKRVLMERGYIVQPADCPPIRNLNSYGYEYFAAARSKVKRHSARQPRSTREHEATFGRYTHSGDRCAKSDSQFYSSWLANSDYFKVITGLLVYCPVGYGLYQGPNPYSEGNSPVHPLAAIEYGNSRGVITIARRRYFAVEMNLVCSMDAEEIEIQPGQSLGVFYPVLNPRAFRLRSVGDAPS